MSWIKTLWPVYPGQVIALIASSMLLGALLAFLLLALFAPPELDLLEEEA